MSRWPAILHYGTYMQSVMMTAQSPEIRNLRREIQVRFFTNMCTTRSNFLSSCTQVYYGAECCTTEYHVHTEGFFTIFFQPRPHRRILYYFLLVTSTQKDSFLFSSSHVQTEGIFTTWYYRVPVSRNQKFEA